jgi:hypothetical protein
MPGSIRFIVGLLLTWGAVGGIDSATGMTLVLLVAVAVAGLVLMYSGARALQEY